MKNTPIRLGPLALLLTVISICLTILAVLTFTTARADMRLAEKYAETVQNRYAVEVLGQEYLSRLRRGAEPPPAADETGVMRTELEQNGFRLRIALAAGGPSGYRILEWRQTKDWEPHETVGDLWGGSFGNGG